MMLASMLIVLLIFTLLGMEIAWAIALACFFYIGFSQLTDNPTAWALFSQQMTVGLDSFVLVAIPIWGVIDAAARPRHHFEAIGSSKRMWIGVQALGAPFGVGFGAALTYFLRTKRRLKRAGVYSDVAVSGDEVNP